MLFRALKRVCYTGVTVPLPYQGECDLVTLLQVMQFMFGDFPPVWMQPRSEPERASCK